MKNNNKPKLPKLLFILKILGFSFLIIGIILIILGVTVLSWEHSPNPAVFAPGMVLTAISLFLILVGFLPDIESAAIKSKKYVLERSKDDLIDIAGTTIKTGKSIQEKSKYDLKEIADTGAEIYSDAVTKTAKAIKEGIKDTMFCKHCGAKIDSDSKFCNQCGKEQ